MATKAQTALAFASKLVASCHNARTGTGIYQLHGHTIAKWESSDTVNQNGDQCIVLLWCGFYTRTTASHMNEILKALGAPMRVSYAHARDNGVKGYELTIQDGELRRVLTLSETTERALPASKQKCGGHPPPTIRKETPCTPICICAASAAIQSSQQPALPSDPPAYPAGKKQQSTSVNHGAS